MKYKSYLFFMSFYNMIMMMITKGEITQLILIVNFPQSIFITVHLWFIESTIQEANSPRGNYVSGGRSV